jgi:hypothetical protein
VTIEAQIRSGEWTDPERGKVKLGDYGSAWITERPGLRPRTMDLYRWLLRKHIEPYLGGVPVGKLSIRQIRKWRANLLANDRAGSAGPGAEDADERPVLTVAQVFELAGQVGRRPVGNIRKIRLAKRPRRPGFDEANPAETIEQRGDAC